MEALAKTPDRWSPTEYAHFEGEPREPSPVLVEEAFAVVEEGLSELGPVAADEPLREHFGDQAVMEWMQFFTKFPSRPGIDPISAREYVKRRGAAWIAELPGRPTTSHMARHDARLAARAVRDARAVDHHGRPAALLSGVASILIMRRGGCPSGIGRRGVASQSPSGRSTPWRAGPRFHLRRPPTSASRYA